MKFKKQRAVRTEGTIPAGGQRRPRLAQQTNFTKSPQRRAATCNCWFHHLGCDAALLDPAAWLLAVIPATYVPPHEIQQPSLACRGKGAQAASRSTSRAPEYQHVKHGSLPMARNSSTEAMTACPRGSPSNCRWPEWRRG